MKIFRNIFNVLTVLIITGCSSFSFLSTTQNNSQLSLAELSDYKLEKGFITITTLGRGCTFYNDFKVITADKEKNSLLVVKTRNDNCRMAPRKVSLQYSIQHLGLDLNKEIRVENPINKVQPVKIAGE